MGNRVFSIVRQAIVQLQLKPGDLLPEAEMARRLGVSRQPVREAFIKLAEVGLVEIRPQRGTSVVKISLRDVENARFIREALEVAVVHRASEVITNEHQKQIEAILDASEPRTLAAISPSSCVKTKPSTRPSPKPPIARRHGVCSRTSRHRWIGFAICHSTRRHRWTC